MAIRAAMTGHLILSTLHTNDAASALSRLVDMGVEPFLAASAVTGILGQRLVRVVCPACAKPCTPAPETLARLGPDARIVTEGLRRGRGCPRCRETGYQGRVGIFELLRMDPDLEDLVSANPRASAIRAKAVAGGMRTLRQDGLLRAERGVTTLEEVLRVT
jgi:general secretion pathway protein E